MHGFYVTIASSYYPCLPQVWTVGRVPNDSSIKRLNPWVQTTLSTDQWPQLIFIICLIFTGGFMIYDMYPLVNWHSYWKWTDKNIFHRGNHQPPTISIDFLQIPHRLSIEYPYIPHRISMYYPSKSLRNHLPALFNGRCSDLHLRNPLPVGMEEKQHQGGRRCSGSVRRAVKRTMGKG